MSSKAILGLSPREKPLTESVNYITRFEELNDKQFDGKQTWSLDELRDLLVKALSYVMGIIGARIANKLPG